MFRKSQTLAIAFFCGILLVASANCSAQEPGRKTVILSEQDALSMFEVYLLLARCDGLSKGEMDLLNQLKEKYGITDRDFQFMWGKIHKLKSISQWTPRMPESPGAQRMMFYRMTSLRNLDGKESEQEKVIFSKVLDSTTLPLLDISVAMIQAEKDQ